MVMTMDVPAVDAYSVLELCTPIWLNHDYGDGEVVDILVVDQGLPPASCGFQRVHSLTNSFPTRRIPRASLNAYHRLVCQH
jgi:hypothetical protein